MAVVEHSGGRNADEHARYYHQRLQDSPQDCCLPTPDRATCSTTGCTSAARSPCTCCAADRRRQFLCAAAGLDARTASTAVTDDFTGLAANYAHESLRPLWDAWLYSTDVPAL